MLDNLGYTPLHVAAKFNQVDQLIIFFDHLINEIVHIVQLKLVKLLLKRSANPKARSAQLELPVGELLYLSFI